MNCRRCGKPFAEGQAARLVRQWAKPDGINSDGQPVWFLHDDRTIATDAYYHERCLPPLLFHKFAGSLPVGQSLPASSPRQRHVAGEGLSSRRNRTRLPHRQRKKIAAKKKLALDQARDERQHARTLAMTATDTIARGGNLRLCSCRTFSKQEYFVTAHGYCRYCGGWQPEVIREHLGEATLQAEIDKLAIHDREKMRELVSQ